jgi:SIR2-like domain
MPGVEPIHDPSLNLTFDKVKQKRRVKSDAFTVTPKYQPYFKLHGSTDWQDADGGPLLVIGGNKSGMIQRHQILTWYAEQFAGYMAQPSSKLMVIGYSFTDAHINRAIHEVSQRSQLQMFIVDPNGREAIRKANPTYGASIYAPQAIEEVAIVGESLRPLNTTFGGKDPLAHGKLLRFFE